MASITATTATSRSRSWSAAGAASWSWHRSATTAGGPERATSPGTPRRSAPTSPCGTRRSRASLGSGVTACRATCAPRASGWATGSGRRAHPSPASRPRPRGPRWNEERYDERHRVAPRLRPIHAGSPRASDALRLRTPTECPGLAGAATMTLLRIGIVGARFAAELHAVNYRPLVGSKVELAAVCARTRSQAEAFAKHHAVARVFTDYRELCASPHVDVVDICSTTDTHHEVAIAAARAGKHVIVEKPLTGAFCEATEPREAMRAAALRNSDAVLDAVTSAGVTLCYAEDFVYAPPVAKLRRLLDASGGAILELRAEESHGGSHAAYAARWRTSGGGSLLPMGSHPMGVVLHLKHSEGLRRHGRPIRARTVLAAVAQLTRLPTVAQERRYLSTKAEDVEDWAVAVITFEDGTKATVHSNDTTLGGVRNVVTAYLTNGVIHANINPNTTVAAYAPDGAVWGDEYITEKVETKAGWQFPSPEEDWMRGYPQELADFVDAIRERREPLAGALVAPEGLPVIQARVASA